MLIYHLFEPWYSWIAMGYFDPGTGSLIIQLVIGFVVVIGASIRIFWDRIKSIFRNGKSVGDNESYNEGQDGNT